MSVRTNNTLRKKWRHMNAPKLASFFLLPVSDGPIKGMSSPDRACLLMPRDVHFAPTLLVSIETAECSVPPFRSPVRAFPCLLVGADPELPSRRNLRVVQSIVRHTECTEPPGQLIVPKCLPTCIDKLQSREALYVFSHVL